MIKENLVAERIAIETYRDMIRYFAEKDPDDARPAREDPRQGRRARQRHARPSRRPRGQADAGALRVENPVGFLVFFAGASTLKLAVLLEQMLVLALVVMVAIERGAERSGVAACRGGARAARHRGSFASQMLP